ncbi:hypothetical protein C0989_000926, partial [Termitomyces sp. Mn162]
AVLEFDRAEAVDVVRVEGSLAWDEACDEVEGLVNYTYPVPKDGCEKDPFGSHVLTESGSRVSCVEFGKVCTAA